MKIYCARPISGCTGEEVIKYYSDVKEVLDFNGYTVYIPMVGKGHMRTEVEFKADLSRATEYTSPIVQNHAIFERDKWMVNNVDIVFANFIGAKSISIGTVMELAWAAQLGKHTVVVMEKDNPHRHAFVLEAADVVFENMLDAMRYLEGFIKMKM